ncbi:hypothetical protein M2440_001017 [Methylorubrum extorquens]|nr:hypothetical protein [Methylorubrum extorquens]MDF9862022.1 hypothetical protein [Methylorubrum pseudosasae]
MRARRIAASHGGMAGRRVARDITGGSLEPVNKQMAGLATGHHDVSDPQAAAAASAAFSWAKAQSSQGVSAARSDASTVAPHQMRRPAGASR